MSVGLEPWAITASSAAADVSRGFQSIFKLVQAGSSWFKLVQAGSSWFKLVQAGSSW